MLHEPERTLEASLVDGPVGLPAPLVRPDPWPEVSVGVATAAASGAVTGGVAAGTWGGASIGAGLCVTGWSVFTLFGSFHDLGPRAKVVLGSAAGIGAVAVGVGLWLRSRRRGGP